jgi:dGTPase
VETSEREGDVAQSEEIGAAMLALRSFMFERVYLGPHAQAEHARAREIVHTIFDHLAARGDESDEIVDFVAGMTDRFALEFAARL